MSVKSAPGLAAASLLFFSFNAVSETREVITERVVVTASRTAQPSDEVLASTTVITREDITISQAPDLLELLRLTAGVDVARGGGPGGQTSVFMRGTNSNHVLVLIDGVRAAAAGTGAFAWETLDVGIIERIEVVRGPAAARWGSDAVGGVIQIFTRRTDGAFARAGYGRYNDRNLQGSWGRQGDGTPVSLAVSARRTDGFSAQNERGFAFDPDDDGFENLSAALNGGWHSDFGLLDWHLRANTGNSEYDQGETDFSAYAGRAGWRQALREGWEHELTLGFARDFLEDESAFGTSEFHTRRVQAGWQHEARINPQLAWHAGYDGWHESAWATGSFRASRWNQGVWSGLDGTHGRFDYQVSGRFDRDQWFGNHWSGQAAAGVRPTQGLRLYASAARAFRAPTFNQLFSPGFGGLFAGNRDLDPESALNLEVGVVWQPAAGHELALNAWENRIDDLIDFAGIDFQAINIAEARVRGTELRYDFTHTDWRAGINATWQDPEDRASGAQLLRRPKRKAAATVDWLAGSASWLGAEIIYNGARPDAGGVELPSYTLVNLRAGWQLGRQFRLEGRLENVADRDYESIYGFNTPGRAWFVALVWEG